MNRVFIFFTLIKLLLLGLFVTQAADVDVTKINRFVDANFSDSCYKRLARYLEILENRPEEHVRVVGASLEIARKHIITAARSIIEKKQPVFLPKAEVLKGFVDECKSSFVRDIMSEVFAPLIGLHDAECVRSKTVKDGDIKTASDFMQKFNCKGKTINPIDIMNTFYEQWFKNYKLRRKAEVMSAVLPVKIVVRGAETAIRPEAAQYVADLLFAYMFGATRLVRSNADDKAISDTSSTLKKIADVITQHAPGFSQGMIDGSEAIARAIRSLALRMEVRRAGLRILPPLIAMQPGKKTLQVAERAFLELTPEDVSRRLDILKEVKAFAERFSCGDYGKETLSELEESLLLLRALMSRDYPHFNYLMIAEKCRVRDELVLAAINYQQAIIWAPDALLRKDFVSRLFRILPDSFAGYERWKASVRQEYTDSRYLVKAIDELREEHKKLLVLYGGFDSDIAFLNQEPRSEVFRMICKVYPDTACSVASSAEVKKTKLFHHASTELQPVNYLAAFTQINELREMRREMNARHEELKQKQSLRSSAKKQRFVSAAKTLYDYDSDEADAVESACAEQTEELPTIAKISKANHSIFLQFFQNKTGESVTLANADEWVNTTWQDNVKVTRTQLERLIENLGGEIKPGKGSHEKITMPALQGVIPSVELSVLCDPRLGSQTATVTSGRDGFIPPYQIEQIRSKLMALGLVPATVIVVRT